MGTEIIGGLLIGYFANDWFGRLVYPFAIGILACLLLFKNEQSAKRKAGSISEGMTEHESEEFNETFSHLSAGPFHGWGWKKKYAWQFLYSTLVALFLSVLTGGVITLIGSSSEDGELESSVAKPEKVLSSSEEFTGSMTLEQARQQMSLLVNLMNEVRVENDDTCTIENGQLCFEPINAELAKDEFLVTFTNRLTESVSSDQLEAIGFLLEDGFDAQQICKERWEMMMKEFGMIAKIRWLSFDNELFAESRIGEEDCKMALSSEIL